MMNKFISNIDYLRQYVNGELSPREMYEIERAAQSDEMLMDILIGLQEEVDLGTTFPKQDIDAVIQSKSEQPQRQKSTSSYNWMAIAASLVLLALGTWYFIPKTPTPDNFTQTPTVKDNNTPQSTEVTSPLQENEEKLIATAPEIRSSVEKNDAFNPSMNQSKEERKEVHSLEVPSTNSLKFEQQPVNKQITYEPNEEVIIASNTKRNNNLATANESQLINTNKDVKVKPSLAPSHTKSQADLQKLNLDPESRRILAQVITRQQQEALNAETTSDSKIARLDTSLKAHNSGEQLAYGKASSMKNNNTKASNTNESIVILGDSSLPSQYGTVGSLAHNNFVEPTIGWKLYNDYFKNKMKAFSVNNYNVKVNIQTDQSGKVRDITILEATPKTMNDQIKQFIKDGSSWKSTGNNTFVIQLKN